jgi:phosphoribosylanthranilate isomerase
VAGLGIDHVGLVLDEGGEPTWDAVDLATARAIRAELPPHTKAVALSLATDPDRVRRTVEALDADVVHLARVADRLSPDDLGRLRQALAPVQVMTTVPVRGPDAAHEAERWAAVSDWLLLDTAHPATGVVGATGCTHDWAVSAAIVGAVDVPVVLAGGLGPDNVADAVARVRPAGVDSETRTSRDDDRRRKDAAKVRQFVERARAADGRARP